MFKGLMNLLAPGSGVPSDERRDTIRLSCSIDVTLLVAGKPYPATVVNVSLTGLCLELDARLKAQQAVVLERDEFGKPLEGQAVWSRSSRTNSRNQLGVMYKADQQMLRASWLTPALKQLGFKSEMVSEKRKLLRVPGQLSCQLKGMTGDTYTEGSMLDLSVGGALVEGEVELPENLQIQFKIEPLGNLKALDGVARVVSCYRDPEEEKWRCGIRFTEVDDTLVRRYLKALMSAR